MLGDLHRFGWVALLAVVLAACGARPSKSDDRDLDGVADAQDRCPLSTPGADVDDDGCEADADADGVADVLDRCPGTQAGALVDLVGCEIDGDCDGVPDRVDQCPRTLLGVRVNAIGCEPGCPDSDSDGVCDEADACPGTPAQAAVDARGCEPGETVVIDGVFFDTNVSTLRPEARTVLDEVLAKLRGRKYERLAIAGHTDARNTHEYNQALSLRRARSVRDYLAANGIPAARISVTGLGETQPVADNETVEGRARNRRVEMRIIGGEGFSIETRPGALPPPVDVSPGEPAPADEAPAEPAEPAPARAPAEPPAAAADPGAAEAAAETPAAEPTATAESGPAVENRWTIVVESFQQRVVAERHHGKLRDAGFAAEIQEAQIDGKAWNRVVIPGFATVASTRDTIRRLREELGYTEPWVNPSQP